jgi:hypothetical protein
MYPQTILKIVTILSTISYSHYQAKRSQEIPQKKSDKAQGSSGLRILTCCLCVALHIPAVTKNSFLYLAEHNTKSLGFRGLVALP